MQSGLSPYLHFGQLSPLTALRAVRRSSAPEQARESFRATLARHGRDRRPYLYGRAELEAARTHDPYWNAAMREMRLTGQEGTADICSSRRARLPFLALFITHLVILNHASC
jgi:deoxyribodipyrimidine photolyase